MSKLKDLEELLELLSIALAREKSSVEYYVGAYQKAKSENGKRVFSLLLEQEKGHEAKLRGQMHEITAEIEIERLKQQK